MAIPNGLKVLSHLCDDQMSTYQDRHLHLGAQPTIGRRVHGIRSPAEEPGAQKTPAGQRAEASASEDLAAAA